MRVYGALMWSIGKVVKTPEVMRVYVGSFWDQPLMCEDNAQLFEMEEADLMRDLKDLPRNSAVRKINELVKRMRACKVHAYIISHLKEQMPYLMGSAKKQKELIANLGDVFKTVLKKYNLAAGDFPEIENFRSILKEKDFTKFNALKPKLVDEIDSVMGVDFPRLMDALPRPDDSTVQTFAGEAPLVYEKSVVNADPFADDDDDEPDSWVVQPFLEEYKALFEGSAVNGAVSGAAAKQVLGASGLPKAQLRAIWVLADVDKDNSLDLHEFAVAMHLIAQAKGGQDLPAALPTDMVPVHKR